MKRGPCSGVIFTDYYEEVDTVMISSANPASQPLQTRDGITVRWP
jgi:hypothetical protein